MPFKFTFDGLDELKAALRALPEELTGEASHIVTDAGNGAAVTIRTAYGRHRHTGNLQDHVTVEPQNAGRFGAGVIVKSSARHASIFERGTQARHYFTVNGVRHETGAMPPAKVFIPTMIRARRGMYESLRDLMERHGLTVTGEP